MTTAKVFWSGRPQAVGLPKAFRFDSNEVRIRRHGNAVILEPVAHDWTWLDVLLGPLDADSATAAAETLPEQERPELDFFEPAQEVRRLPQQVYLVGGESDIPDPSHLLAHIVRPEP